MSSVAENDAPPQAKTTANDVPQDVPHIAIANIPAQLKALPQWVCWKWETRNGKRTKPPYDARTGGKASSTDPATWSTFKTALVTFNTGGYAGIGFVLTKETGIVGIDLDHVLDGAQGVMEWPHGSRLRIQPAEVVALLDTYTEVTPSGAGLRCFVFGELPNGWRKAGDVEVYDSGRFLTVTGHHWPDSPPTIETRPGEVTALHAGMLPPPVVPPAGLNGHAGNGSNGDGGGHLTASELWAVMFRAKNGGRIRQLFEGAWQAAGYGSQSEADSALCHDLAFYAEGDVARVDGLFRETGLFREKWDKRHYGSGETYGLHTVAEACRRTVKHYAGPRPKPSIKNTRATAQAGSNNGTVPPQEPKFTRTDAGNADRLIWRHGDDVRYCYQSKKWYCWDGARWAEDGTGEIERRAEETALSIFEEGFKAEGETRDELMKWGSQSLGRKKLLYMIECAHSKAAIKIEMMDADPWLLNCQNGTLDLRTGKLREHRRDDLFTKLVPVDFDPDATCPAWEDFLIRIMGCSYDEADPERVKRATGLVEFLQRAIGYTLTGSDREQCMFILHGVGSNGKSTLLRTLTALLHDYALQTPPETLMSKKDEGVRNDLARLRGARLVSAIETEDNRRLAESLIKQLTGGDKIAARFLFQEFFEFSPQFKLFLSTNHKPVVRGTDHAIWRRLHMIPFEVKYWNPDKGETGAAELQVDKTLPERLAAELPGILAWAVRGCLIWQADGLKAPEAVQEATRDYRREMDTLSDFIDDCCTEKAALVCTVTELYNCYARWAEDSGEYVLSKKALSLRLSERGLESFQETTGERRRCWKGICLKDLP